MQLTDITSGKTAAFVEKGYGIPTYNRAEMIAKTKANPTWLHFGAGNIFRAFPAALLEKLLCEGACDTGVIVAEGFDFEIIEKAYTPYDNLSLLAVLRADGTVEKKVIGSIAEALRADKSYDDWNRLEEIFANPSLQMVTFTITEKGYSLKGADGNLSPVAEKDLTERGLSPILMMGKLTALLYTRYKTCKAPITLSSMDNCSHNGDKVKEGVLTYAKAMISQGVCEEGFLDYVTDPKMVSYPWSMIDKITPRPDAKVSAMLSEDAFTDTDLIITNRNTYTSPFVNAEETEYLVIEDDFVNGRPALEKAGVLYTDRETVDKVEKMKVCTCLNPLHTALAIYGCMLGYTLISEEMKDPELCKMITDMGYIEAMPVVVNPGILKPEDFIGAVLTKRLPNPFMPDAPQRIATDTSQKLSIRFGETLKAYCEKGLDLSTLRLIPLVLAGYARYLSGLDDNGEAFTQSSDPLLSELQKVVAGYMLGGENDYRTLRNLYSRTDIFGVNLYEIGIGETVEQMVKELYAAPGAIRETLKKYVNR